jgi:mutator protein MutT
LSGQALAQSLEMKSPRKKVYRLSKMSQELVFAEGRKVPHGLKSRNAIKVAAGMLIHNGKVLIATRPKGKLLAGLWEFPGGKLEPGEDERTCLKREFMEELGVEVAVRPYFYKTFTDEDGLDILLTFHRCSLLLGEVNALEGQDFKWVDAEDLDKYEFPRANREVIEILKEKRGMFLH